MQTIIYILPELFLSSSIMILLMIGVFVKKSFKLIYLLTILSMIFSIILLLNQPDDVIKIFNIGFIFTSKLIFEMAEIAGGRASKSVAKSSGEIDKIIHF